jgi:hypothetical protein
MEDEDFDGDADNINLDDEENSEAAPILNSWNLDYTTAMVNNDRHDSAWYYYQNNVSARALYPDKQHLQDGITAWAMSTQTVFKTIMPSEKYLIVERINDRCPVRVHVYHKKMGHGVGCQRPRAAHLCYS